VLLRQFEYLFGEIRKINAKHRFEKSRRNESTSVQKARITVSPSVKGTNLNYQQFGDDIEEISFEIDCSYTEIYNEQIHDLLDPSQQSKL